MQFSPKIVKIGIACHQIMIFLYFEEAMSSVLKSLSTFTDALAGEKVVTVSAVRPLLKHILEDLLVVSSDDCSLVKEMKETISDDLSARYINLELSELNDKCSYLDPRFRTRYLNNKEETLVQIKFEACRRHQRKTNHHLPRNLKDWGQF